MLQVFVSWTLVQTPVPLLKKGIYCRVTPRKYLLHMCVYNDCDELLLIVNEKNVKKMKLG